MSGNQIVTITQLTQQLVQKYISVLLDLDQDVTWDRWTAEKFLNDRPGKWDFSLVALFEDNPVGFIIASSKFDSLHIHYIMVDMKWRSMGLGTEMLRFLADRAGQTGKRFITLKCYLADTRAIMLYRKRGFFEIGTDSQKGIIEMQARIEDI